MTKHERLKKRYSVWIWEEGKSGAEVRSVQIQLWANRDPSQCLELTHAVRNR